MYHLEILLSEIIPLVIKNREAIYYIPGAHNRSPRPLTGRLFNFFGENSFDLGLLRVYITPVRGCGSREWCEDGLHSVSVDIKPTALISALLSSGIPDNFQLELATFFHAIS